MTTIATTATAARGQATRANAEGRAWSGLYQAGAVTALLTVLLGLLDSLIMFLPGGATPAPGTWTVAQWFAYFQANPFLGLRALGLLNVLTNCLAVPTLLALYGAHRRANPAFAALAVLVLCLGASIYVANNTALPMLALSGHYAAAAGESERALLVASGQALLAREDLTAGAFPGFFFAEVAQLLMAAVMLRGGTFGRKTACAGLLGFGAMLLFNVVAAFVPAAYDPALLLAMLAALLVLAYELAIARALFRLAQSPSPAEED